MTKTIEIMGGNLDLAFKELGIEAVKLVEINNKEQYWTPFQVWELDKAELSKVNKDNWKDEYGWYRIGETMDNTKKTFIVNGKEMIGHYNEDSYLEMDFDDETDEEIVLPPHKVVHDFDNFGEYFTEYLGLSTEYNYVYFSTLFAKLNNMKLSEFVKTYY